MIGRRPLDRTGRRIERDDPGILTVVAAADVGDDAAVLDERRARRAEEALRNGETARGIDAPDALAVGEIERVQLPFGAERVDAILCDDGNGARPFVEAEIVAIGGRIRKSPARVAASCVERLDHLFVADAMKQDQAIASDDRPGKPLSDGLAPDALRSARRP